jgi:hypothetical protein
MNKSNIKLHLYIRLGRTQRYKHDARASINQREQYGGTFYLFISTGRSPVKITYISFTTYHNHDTNYHGPVGHFIFKSVQPFVSRRVAMPKLPGKWLQYVSSRYACFCVDLSKVFFLKGPSATKQTPNSTSAFLHWYVF